MQARGEQGLQRLYHYTRLTKWIFYGEDNAPEHDAFNLHGLYTHYKGTTLFPSLHKLYLLVWPLSVAEANLLFSPSLSVISFPHSSFPSRTLSRLGRSQQEQMCIHLLGKRCPSLQEFSNRLWDPPPASVRLLEPLFSLEQLSCFWVYLGPATASDRRGEWLEKASKTEYLKEFCFSTINLSNGIVSRLDLGPFSRLERLFIAGSISALSSIFSSMCSNLKVVSLEADIGEEWYDMKNCLQLLVNNSGRRLTSFRLQPATNHSSAPPSLSVVLQPLLKVFTLEDVSITLPCSVTDHDITVFASAWPNLRFIDISRPSLLKSESNVRAGFRALIELATRCPCLRSIDLNLDLNNPPPIQDIPNVNHSLRWLEMYHVTDSTDEKMWKIATVVNRLFPSLAMDVDPHYTDYNWAKVLGFITTLRAQPPSLRLTSTYP